jgi:hypothetical protein
MVHAPKVGTLCNGEFSVKRLTLLAEYGDRSNVFLRSGNVAPVTVNLRLAEPGGRSASGKRGAVGICIR